MTHLQGTASFGGHELTSEDAAWVVYGLERGLAIEPAPTHHPWRKRCTVGDLQFELETGLRRLDPESANPYLLVALAHRGNRYVQFFARPSELYAEAVGNAWLEDSSHLDLRGEVRLEDLGWLNPTDRSSGNYWRIWTHPVPWPKVVTKAVLTLERCYGAGDTHVVDLGSGQRLGS